MTFFVEQIIFRSLLFQYAIGLCVQSILHVSTLGPEIWSVHTILTLFVIIKHLIETITVSCSYSNAQSESSSFCGTENVGASPFKAFFCYLRQETRLVTRSIEKCR